jgi:hypothetical protein
MMMMEAVEATAGNAGQPAGSDVVLQHGQALCADYTRIFCQLSAVLWTGSGVYKRLFFLEMYKMFRTHFRGKQEFH